MWKRILLQTGLERFTKALNFVIIRLRQSVMEIGDILTDAQKE